MDSQKDPVLTSKQTHDNQLFRTLPLRVDLTYPFRKIGGLEGAYLLCIIPDTILARKFRCVARVMYMYVSVFVNPLA